MYTVGIITISDKGAAGQREDKSGPKIKELLPKDKYDVVSYKIIPDERKLIADELVRLCDDVKCNLVLTTGGTGFSPRDITPEATMDIAERNAPGIAEALRAYSMSLTPKAMLGRGASVIRKNTLIVNLPGSVKAVSESMDFLMGNIEHGLDILLQYEADDATADVVLDDGEGYVSANGFEWENVKNVENCNICIKAFSNDR